MSAPASPPSFDLAAAALNDLHIAGFHPEFTPEALAQLRDLAAQLAAAPVPTSIPDQRSLPWSSIDNDTSRDLDQIECAERLPNGPQAGIRLHVAIADVAAAVPRGSPLDLHAAAQTQTIYTAVHNFPMLPVQLSTDLTSLNENADRLALVLSFTVPTVVGSTVSPDGSLRDGSFPDEQVTRALVRNRAQLAYSRVGPWLESATPANLPDPFTLRSDSAPHLAQPPADTRWLADQLHLQDEAAQHLRAARRAAGALDFQRAEADPVVADGQVVDLREIVQNRAMHLVEDLMVAANGVMARALRAGGRSCLQRVVRVPQRWDRIVALAADRGQGRGTTLPPQPDPVALNHFLEAQRTADPAHYPELAVAVIKLLGAGEYILMRPTDDPTGHFGLAARDYTHSTAPNRRFPDLVTQRILHSMLDGTPAPYTDDELAAIAAHCNDADKALRKIDRATQKRVAAVALRTSIGHTFHGVITGATPTGTYVRVFQPPFEGRITQGESGLDVGQCVTVRLLRTDPVHAFIDLAFLTATTC